VRLSVSAPAVLNSPGALDAPSPGRQLMVEVLDRRGRLLGRSLSLGARLLPTGPAVKEVQRSGRARFDYVTLSGTRLRRYTAPVADVGGQASGGVVMAAADVSDITTTTQRLHKLLVITGLAAIALAGALAAVLVGRGLRPLRRLSRAAAEIERTGDPSQRLPEASSADEIAELTAVLNGMLATLESARESERRFLADASHELRTPVAALAGNLEYAQRHGTDPELLADLRHDAARLARLVDQLLLLERQDGAGPADEPVDLAKLAEEAVAGIDRATTGTLEPAEVPGDRDALGGEPDRERARARTGRRGGAGRRTHERRTRTTGGVRRRARAGAGRAGASVRALLARRHGRRTSRRGARAADRGGDREPPRRHG
jgi:signal transduction histidine kinase